jgi:hypothetical protein
MEQPLEIRQAAIKGSKGTLGWRKATPLSQIQSKEDKEDDSDDGAADEKKTPKKETKHESTSYTINAISIYHYYGGKVHDLDCSWSILSWEARTLQVFA